MQACSCACKLVRLMDRSGFPQNTKPASANWGGAGGNVVSPKTISFGDNSAPTCNSRYVDGIGQRRSSFSKNRARKEECQLSEISNPVQPSLRLELPYRLCDVFTATAFQGNQLAVFEDAGELTSVEMQKLANETNLSETTFIVRRDAATERREGVRVRIFTTQEELPFAGHPTLGTACTIRSFFPEYADAEEIVLDLNIGKIPVVFSPDRQRGNVPYGVMTQARPAFGALHEPARAAAALGLSAADLLAGAMPQTVSTGLAYCVVPLRSLEALGRLQIPQREAAAYLATMGARFFYCLAPVPGEPNTWQARMQFYNGEDPATGSAAGCAISYLVAHSLAESERQVHLRQGIEIGRASDLYVSAKKTADGIDQVQVGGSTVPVAKGLVFLERFT
jgi:trans-2,3-dihydro-3-hydroxyanthranilate isomerase